MTNKNILKKIGAAGGALLILNAVPSVMELGYFSAIVSANTNVERGVMKLTEPMPIPLPTKGQVAIIDSASSSIIDSQKSKDWDKELAQMIESGNYVDTKTDEKTGEKKFIIDKIQTHDAHHLPGPMYSGNPSSTLTEKEMTILLEKAFSQPSSVMGKNGLQMVNMQRDKSGLERVRDVKDAIEKIKKGTLQLRIAEYVGVSKKKDRVSNQAEFKVRDMAHWDMPDAPQMPKYTGVVTQDAAPEVFYSRAEYSKDKTTGKYVQIGSGIGIRDGSISELEAQHKELLKQKNDKLSLINNDKISFNEENINEESKARMKKINSEMKEKQKRELQRLEKAVKNATPAQQRTDEYKLNKQKYDMVSEAVNKEPVSFTSDGFDKKLEDESLALIEYRIKRLKENPSTQ